MKIILQKESFLNSIKAVKGIVSTRGVQPILGAILIESVSSDRIKLTTTDLNLSISYTTKAEVEKEGKIAINAKVIEDIITKMPDKNITIELNIETNTIKIQSEKTKFEVISLNAEEFPNVLPYRPDPPAEAPGFSGACSEWCSGDRTGSGPSPGRCPLSPRTPGVSGRSLSAFSDRSPGQGPASPGSTGPASSGPERP